MLVGHPETPINCLSSIEDQNIYVKWPTQTLLSLQIINCCWQNTTQQNFYDNWHFVHFYHSTLFCITQTSGKRRCRSTSGRLSPGYDISFHWWYSTRTNRPWFDCIKVITQSGWVLVLEPTAAEPISKSRFWTKWWRFTWCSFRFVLHSRYQHVFVCVCVCVCTSACVMLVWPGSFKVYMIWEHSGQLTRHGFIMLPNFY